MRRAIALVVLALAACSQTAALAPVGGDRLAEVRFAAIDVLMDQRVELLVAPVCTASGEDDDDIACAGTTLDGRPITAVSSAEHQDRLVVTVDGKVIHDGDLQAVLTSAARPTP
jgi:hypothetical protein